MGCGGDFDDQGVAPLDLRKMKEENLFLLDMAWKWAWQEFSGCGCELVVMRVRYRVCSFVWTMLSVHTDTKK